MASLFPGGMLKNAAHTSPGNPEYFNQSDDDLAIPEVFPSKCAVRIRRSASGRISYMRISPTPSDASGLISFSRSEKGSLPVKTPTLSLQSKQHGPAWTITGPVEDLRLDWLIPEDK